MQSGQLPGEQIVLGAEAVPAFFLLHLLAAQFKKLVLLPDIAHAGTADEEADQYGLHRRPKADYCRLVFPISRHVKFSPVPVTARCAPADSPRVPPRPAESPCVAPN